MQEQIKKALEFSNYRQTLSIQRKNLKEKIDAKLTYGSNGGIFKIDQSLILFVEFLINQERDTDVVLIDVNNNPILIPILRDFQTDILDRYFTSLFEYYEQYESIKKSRSVEKLIDL